jgi:hypothetical protein
MVKFLRHLLPILSPSFVAQQQDKVLTKVMSNLDTFLPFRQHAPSLANARREIYLDVDRLERDDGVWFFNILAFRGVFFGSPFSRSDRYRWFDSLADWESFRNTENEEEKKYKGEQYYVCKNCYGQSQTGRELSLLSLYWNQRTLWNEKFQKPNKPTVLKVHRWLTSRVNNQTSQTSSTLFSNIGTLSALLICSDLVEVGTIAMPSAKEWANLVHKLGMGSKSGMEMCKFIEKDSSRDDFSSAFASLDQALQMELREEEKEAMGYNIIMLEHALCKIQRISKRVSENVFISEVLK